MAFETEVGNVYTQAAVSAQVGAAIAEASVALATTKLHNLGGSQVHRFNFEGVLVAEDIAESTGYTYSANSEYAETGYTSTAKKTVVGTKLTVEMLRFGPERINIPAMLNKAGTAIAAKIDADLKTLFASLSQGVTAPTTMTPEVISEAAYLITSSLKTVWSSKLVALIDDKAQFELKNYLLSTAAAAFTNTELLGPVLGSTNPSTRFAGRFLGVDFWVTSGLATDSGDDIAAMWDPEECFISMIDERGVDSSEHAPHASNGITNELLAWFFNKVHENRDLAGAFMKSDT